MSSSFEQKLSRSPVLPAAACGYLLLMQEPFASGNTVALVILLVCGLWLTTTFARFAKSDGFVAWLLGR